MDIKSLIILKCFCILILHFNPFVEGDILYGICANPACSVPIGRGVTILRYSSPDDSRVSVEPNEEVEIFVKDYGPKKDLWGVVVRGNRGYISKQFIREVASYGKKLVPATTEFKTSLLVTNSYTVTSHLHVSSHHQKSDGLLNDVPESIIHTQSAQRSINTLPSDVQNSERPSESLQASHFSPQFNPSDQLHINLHSELDDFSKRFDAPEHSSHFQFNSENILPTQSYEQDVRFSSMHQENNLLSSSFPQNGINSVPDIQQKHSYSKHLRPSSDYSVQESQEFSQYTSNVHQQDSVQPNVEQQYSQQPSLHSQQPSMHHQHSQQPSMHHQYLQEPSMHHQHSQQPSMQQNMEHLHHSQKSNIHQKYSQQPSMHQQQFHSSSMHQQQYQSPSVSEMHSSFSEVDFDEDEDMSKTFAMLRSRSIGVDDPDMLISSHPKLHIQSSQNMKVEYGSEKVEMNAVPSHSHYVTTENSGTSVHSSLNLDPSINQENVMKSEVMEENKSNKPFEENFEKFYDKKDHTTVTDKTDEVNLDEENIGNKNKELESEIVVEDYDEEEEEEEEEDDEEADAVDDILGELSSQISVENQETSSNLESSMSSSLFNQQTSNRHADVQSSSISENHIVDSSDLSEFVSTDFDSNLQKETEIFIEGHMTYSQIQPSVVEKSVNKISEINELNSTIHDSSKPLDMLNVTVDNTGSENSLKSDINEGRKFEKDSFLNRDGFSDIPDRNNNDALQVESGTFDKENTAAQINEFFAESEQTSEMNKFVNTLETDGMEDNLMSTYQIRNLKGEYTTTEEQQSDADVNHDENNTQSDSDIYRSFENGLDAIKSLIDSIMAWIPDPLYSALMDLQKKGISPRVPVFTVLCGFTCIFLIVPIFYIKEWSKESKLSAQLASIEKDAYTLSATNAVLEEKLESARSELSIAQKSVENEKNISEELRTKLEEQAEELSNIKAELDDCIEELESLRKRESDYLTILNDNEKDRGELLEQKSSLEKIIKDNEDTITNLSDQLQESENNVKELDKEKMQYMQLKEDYEEKLTQFEQNCNQLLQEAEVWNLRVNELTAKIKEEGTLKEELEKSVREKDEEIESMKNLIETFKIFDEIEDPEEQAKTKEEKLQTLMKTSLILNQLKKQEEETASLDEQLGKEKSKILDMEVELLEAKSEIDKLKINYNQALQDKAEAQTKLDVLTNYFKDKEIQLQRQLGAQEAVRQKKEDDVNSAERRICLIEQENTSYKCQVASMKQEMEETERNLKSQIAVQEKKAHDNWIAARAAERKLEEVKQEVTQLRQRLTLLEREQENWTNSTRDEIIRPVPKRAPGVNEESGNQDMNTSERGIFPPPLHDRLPPVPPMMLPPDRPLPPLPPPPIPHMFLPPMDRHFRPQPWHLPSDHSSDFRTTPPEFMAGRETTPPRGRPYAIADGDTGPHASSPLTTDTRDSRNSTPPHLLPDFHDVPPQPGGRPFFPPPLGHPRLPMHPPYRRDVGSKRLDNPSEYSSRGPQQAPSQEQWQHSRV